MPEPVVLITGASSGIGRAVAEAFAHQGAKLVLSGRRRDRLESLRERLHGVNVTVVPADLADSSCALPLVSSTIEAHGRLDVLINNAGFGTQARFEEMTEEDVAKMFAVNVLSPMALARAAVPIMRCDRSEDCVIVWTRPACCCNPAAIHKGHAKALACDHEDPDAPEVISSSRS